MSNLGLAGQTEISPTTFIVNLTGFIPGGYSLLYYGCMGAGLFMVATAIYRQIDTAKGRSEHTAAQNLIYSLYGAGFALLAEYIGYIGKAIYGDFQDVSLLVYAAQESQSFSRLAITSFMYLLQFIGACAVAAGWRQASAISSGRPSPDQTWTGVFWFIFGGISLMFIQPVIGVFSAITGMPVSEFINSL